MGEKFWMPSSSEMTKLGIKFQMIKQNPGDGIYVGYNTYHWVLNPVSFLNI
jgi:hypothetical protein